MTGEHKIELYNLLEQSAIISRELLVTVMKVFGTHVKVARWVKGTVENG
jgi:hypothetical protein